MQGVGAAGDGPAGAFALRAGVAQVQGGQVQPEAGAGVAVEVDDPPVGGEGEAQPVVVDGLPVGGGYGGLDGQQQGGGAEQPVQQGSGGGHAADGYQTARPSTVRRTTPDGPSGVGRLVPVLPARGALHFPVGAPHHPHERTGPGPVVRQVTAGAHRALSRARRQ